MEWLYPVDVFGCECCDVGINYTLLLFEHIKWSISCQSAELTVTISLDRDVLNLTVLVAILFFCCCHCLRQGRDESRLVGDTRFVVRSLENMDYEQKSS